MTFNEESDGFHAHEMTSDVEEKPSNNNSGYGFYHVNLRGEGMQEIIQLTYSTHAAGGIGRKYVPKVGLFD